MFIEPMLFSFILAKFRNGKFENIEKLEFRQWYLILIAGGIQLALTILRKVNPIWAAPLLGDYFKYIHIFSYILIIYCILMNIKKPSMKFFLIGVLLNFLVIAANSGKMPVSITGFKGINSSTTIELPTREFDIKHTAVSPDTKLVYLSDIILISKPYPLPKILSIGDIFIMLGLFIFIQEIMLLKDNKTSQFP
ncbi:MAG: DUF5317 domain-containing protein [Tissierellia bacterium]|nr:DUF5317 domain-containing protein [Tissierellia bacterium]